MRKRLWGGGGGGGSGGYDNYFLYETRTKDKWLLSIYALKKGRGDHAVIVKSQRHAAVFAYVGHCGNTADNRRINAQMLGGQ